MPAVEHRGWLMKQGGKVKRQKRRFFVLAGGTLRYFKGAGPGERVLGDVDLNKVEAVQDGESFKGSDFCIVMTAHDRTWYFWAANEKEQRAWIDALLDATAMAAISGKDAPAVQADTSKESEKGIRVLLLGVANVGKTTVIRQLRVFCGSGFSEKRLAEFRPQIWQNVLSLTVQVADFGAKLALTAKAGPEAQRRIDEVLRAGAEAADERAMQLVCAAWRESCMHEAFRRRFEFGNVLTNAAFFVAPATLARVANPRYIPTLDDVLRSRKATKGVSELMFQYKFHQDVQGEKFHPVRVYDVGGQRAERRKHWGALTKRGQQLSVIVYVVSLSAFDEFGEKSSNAMQESMVTFKDLLSDPEIVVPKVYVLLNKQDALKEKLDAGVKLSVCPAFKVRTTSI